MSKIENICLVDLDGTLVSYEKKLLQDLKRLASPKEPPLTRPPRDDAPDYLRARSDLIRANSNWWATLPKLKLGMDMWYLAGELGFRRVILTQGPKRNPSAWKGKKIWIDNNLGNETDVIITRDKGLVYGKVLVDDWPEYVEKWLKWRPRGLAIMPSSKYNEKFIHEQIIHYDGSRSCYKKIKARLQAINAR